MKSTFKIGSLTIGEHKTTFVDLKDVEISTEISTVEYCQNIEAIVAIFKQVVSDMRRF